MSEHSELAKSFKRVMEQRSGTITWEQERAHQIAQKREQAEREAQHAADLAEAERLRQEAIAEQKKLPAGIPIPAELPVVTYDPVHGSLVKLSGDKSAAERLLGVEIQG